MNKAIAIILKLESTGKSTTNPVPKSYIEKTYIPLLKGPSCL
jgi:hypothetical protein